MHRSLLLTLTLTALAAAHAQVPQGAWQHSDAGTHTVWLLQDGYFTSTTYTDSAFVLAFGGPYAVRGGQLIVQEEFNTATEGLTTDTLAYALVEGSLTVGPRTFRRSDKGTGPLAGVWQITQRLTDEGKLVPVQQSGTRKTLKMLTGSRFQWFAIDPGTNDFHGTGGGTYAFSDGKYTEHIAFFSRNPKRIGALLTFNAKVKDGRWHHTGQSSSGEEMHEVWERVGAK